MEDNNPILRDKNGRVKRGSRAINPAGGDMRLARLKTQLDQLTPRAISKLSKLIDSDSDQVSLAACREVLDRNLGRVKASIDLKVESSLSDLHMAALLELADRQRVARASRLIDITPDPASPASPMLSVIEAMDYSDDSA